MKKMSLKPIIMSALAAIAFGTVTVGTTFALFTDKAETKINVKAGVVDIKSVPTIEKAYSLDPSDNTQFAEVSGGKFLNKGTYEITPESEIKIVNATPGDKVLVKVTPTNTSNVNIKWRFKALLSGNLMGALEVKLLDQNNNAVEFIDSEDGYYTKWSESVAAGTALKDYFVSIEFVNKTDAENNQYNDPNQTFEASIALVYEAVQGNAVVTDAAAKPVVWDPVVDDPATIDVDEIKTHSDEKIVENSDKGTSTVELSTPGQLQAVFNEIETTSGANQDNYVIELQRDLDLNGEEWDSLNLDGYAGSGLVYIKGNGHFIKGLTKPLISKTWAGKSRVRIENLTIKDSTIQDDVEDTTESKGVGAFIGIPEASEEITFKNCHLDNVKVEGGHWTGGFYGYAAGYNGNDGPVFETITLEECSVKNSTFKGKGSVGAIAGHASGSAWTKLDLKSVVVEKNTIIGTKKDKLGFAVGTVGAGSEFTVAGVTNYGGLHWNTTGVVIKNNAIDLEGSYQRVYGRFGSDPDWYLDGVRVIKAGAVVEGHNISEINNL